MPIAWPAVADGVAQGNAPNRAFSVRFPMTGATWLLMVVAAIVWNPGIGFFAYGTILGRVVILAWPRWPKPVSGISPSTTTHFSHNASPRRAIPSTCQNYSPPNDAPGTKLRHTPAPPSGSAAAVAPASSHAPAPPPALIGVITPIRQQILRRNAVNQRLCLGTIDHRSRRDPQIDRYSVGIYRQMQFGVGPPLVRPMA